MINKPHIAFCLLLLVFGCREPFDGFDFVGVGGKLVIEAIVTDSGEHGYVRLSYSEGIQGDERLDYRFESGATVVVVDDQGMEYPFASADSGRYVNPTFRPVFGRSYRLEVQVNENRFESAWEGLAVEQADPLELSYRPDTRLVLNDLGNPIDQNVVKISDVIKRHDHPQQFYWQLKHFYIFEAYGHPDIAHLLPEAEHFCYVQDQDAAELIIHRDGGGNIEGIPEHGLDINTIPFGRNMVYDYSVQVIRFNVSQTIYDYLERIQSQIQNTGGVFDAAPSEIEGNITPVSGDLEVLGFFGVFNATSDRLFFNQNELPFPYGEFPDNDDDCFREEEDQEIDSLSFVCWNCLAVASQFVSADKPDWWR